MKSVKHVLLVMLLWCFSCVPVMAQVPGNSGGASTAQTEEAPAQEEKSKIPMIYGPTFPQDALSDISPKMLEALYHEIWQQIGNNYVDPKRLKDWHLWEKKYEGKLNTLADLDLALKELVGAVGDRWTQYASAADREKGGKELAAGRFPLGLSVRRHDDGQVYLEALTYASPAHLSALREGDRIVSINGKEAAKLTDAEIEKMLAGKPGEKITIVFYADNSERKAELTFAAFNPYQVGYSLLPGKIGYVRLPTFASEKVAGQFITALFKVLEAGDGQLNGLILDLRYNHGGYANLAVIISSLFLEEGIIYRTTTREDRVVTESTFRSIPTPPFQLESGGKGVSMALDALQKSPMVVLVNGSTASSSEITTGALQDNKRAYVVGTHTFGKAYGFVIKELPNGGALQLTVMGYLTPKGTDISKSGIVPDKVVLQPRQVTQDKKDVQLEEGLRYLHDILKDRLKAVRAAKEIATAPHGTVVSVNGVHLGAIHIFALVVLVFALAAVMMFIRARKIAAKAATEAAEDEQ